MHHAPQQSYKHHTLIPRLSEPQENLTATPASSIETISPQCQAPCPAHRPRSAN